MGAPSESDVYEKMSLEKLVRRFILDQLIKQLSTYRDLFV